VILFTLAGFAVSHFFAVESALALGLIVGLIVAPLVPPKGACEIPQRKTESDGEP
jgi:hypothetical protein